MSSVQLDSDDYPTFEQFLYTIESRPVVIVSRIELRGEPAVEHEINFTRILSRKSFVRGYGPDKYCGGKGCTLKIDSAIDFFNIYQREHGRPRIQSRNLDRVLTVMPERHPVSDAPWLVSSQDKRRWRNQAALAHFFHFSSTAVRFANDGLFARILTAWHRLVIDRRRLALRRAGQSLALSSVVARVKR